MNYNLNYEIEKMLKGRNIRFIKGGILYADEYSICFNRYYNYIHK